MKRTILLMAISLAIFFSCDTIDNGNRQDEDPEKTENIQNDPVIKPVGKVSLTQQQKEHVNAANSFAFEVYGKCAGEKTCVFSPISIESMLGMAANVVPEEDKSVILNVLGYGGDDVAPMNEYVKSMYGQLHALADEVEFTSANLVLFANDPAATETLETYYSAKIGKIGDEDGSKAAVDRWVSEITHGMIDHVTKYEVNAKWMAYNALYFNGTWYSPFSKKNTRSESFHRLSGAQEQVEMMSQTMECPYYEDGRLQAIQMSYGRGEYAMTVILPKSDDAFREVEHTFSHSDWAAIKKAYEYCTVDIKLPKFDTHTEGELKELLNDVYVFSEMHMGYFDTVISVSEEGTTASSSSQGIGVDIAPGPDMEIKTREFTADHPFIYTISEISSGAILFIGQFCGKY